MISVLIPVHNYDVSQLVLTLHKQLLNLNISFEILIYDDASTHSTSRKSLLNKLSYTSYIVLKQNIGRAAIRNKLGNAARYNSLLFLDAGTEIKNSNFIKTYLPYSKHNLVLGGITFLKTPPKKPYKLRWLYTKKREQQWVGNTLKRRITLSANFLIQKAIFISHVFDESIITYGHEDSVFFENLKQKNIAFTYINNPVIHSADDDANTFITKTEQSINNLIQLINKGKLKKQTFAISRMYYLIKSIRLNKIILLLFLISKGSLKRHFNSSYPSIYLFDFYKLGYFCYLKNKA